MGLLAENPPNRRIMVIVDGCQFSDFRMKNSSFKLLVVPVFAVICLLFADISTAQPPGFGRGGDRDSRDRGSWGRDRGSWGRDRGSWGRGGSDRGRGGFDPSMFISRMDRNKNGKLDPDEISDRARPFIEPRLKEAGFDPSKPIEIKKLTEAYQKRREEEQKKADKKAQAEDFSTIPDLSYVAQEVAEEVPGIDIPDDSPLLKRGKLEDRYDGRILGQVNDTLRRYDKNGNGMLDAAEVKTVRWQSPWQADDLDKDGRMNKVELAERYVKRFGGNSKSKSSSRSSYSRSSRDRDRSRSRSDERKRSDSRSSRDKKDSDSKRTTSSSRTKSRSSGDDKITEYAKSMMSRYDKDKNNILDEKEMGSMRRKPKSSADSNKDGKISLNELIVSYGGKPKAESSRVASKGRQSEVDQVATGLSIQSQKEKLEDIGVDEEFLKLDTNKDAHVDTGEFAKEWDNEVYKEFREKDVNGDGLISANEWINN